MKHRLLLPLVALSLACVALPPAQAQGRGKKSRPAKVVDKIYGEALARSAEVCPDHSNERSRPGVDSVPAEALRTLHGQGVALCPDQRLDSSTPLVWYGPANVFAWNPAVKGVTKQLGVQAAAYARQESLPRETVVWKANGKPAEGALVPAFRRMGARR